MLSNPLQRTDSRYPVHLTMSDVVLSVQTWENIDAGIPVDISGDLDSSTCLVSFQQHWNQASDIIRKSWNLPGGVSPDDVSCVINNLEQMASLILVDAQLHKDAPGPIMELLLKENILGTLLEWSLQCEEYAVPLKLEQLKIYELLFSHSHLKLWGHRVLLKPLLELISSCKDPINTEVEKRLVVLLNQLCVSLMQDMELLNLFFSVSPEQDPSRFILFSLLIPFVHRDGSIGQQARDALLLCMALSRKSEKIASYIGKHSSLCPVLATGLSGLYSALPHRLQLPIGDGSSNSWHCLLPDDGDQVPELQVFLESLDFTNAIFQISHPLVQTELLEYIFHGFLVPVMGPALHEIYSEEVVAATAYLDLFLRSVSEPSLVYVFLKFIFTCKYEGCRIIDTIISRLTGCKDRAMALTTLSLLRTLVDLNCEDVMLDMVLKHLLPGSHVMVSQRRGVSRLDARSATRILNFVPRCCRGDHASGGQESKAKLGVYLREARGCIKATMLACRSWRFGYEQCESSAKEKELSSESTLLDSNFKASPIITRTGRTGIDGDVWRKRGDSSWTQKRAKSVPGLNVGVVITTTSEPNTRSLPRSDVDVNEILSEIDAVVSEMNLASPDCEQDGLDVQSFFDSYLLAPWKQDPIDPNEAKTYDSNKPSQLEGFTPVSPLPPDIGPFLNSVFERLECMLENDFRVNLQLTGLVSKLAAFPHPVLRSFLLSDALVCQPSVRSLPQVLASLRQKFDQATAGISNVGDVVKEARRFLRDVAPRSAAVLRGGIDDSSKSATPVSVRQSSFAHKVESRYQSLASKFFRRGNKTRLSTSNDVGKSGQNGSHHPDSGFLEQLPGDCYRYTLVGECPKEKSVSSTPSSTRMGFVGETASRKAPRRVVLAAVLFDEWVHELAALALEHSLATEEFSFFFPTSPTK